VEFNIPRVVIAGLKGGCGKTTLSIGLIRLLKKNGFKVASFKKGPDYIDSAWLSKAAGNKCYNLDLFMISSDKLLLSFIHHAKDSDIGVIEGNRGIYDGVDVEGSCSTAELARLLKAPIVIVVDCKKSTRTIAALIKGVQFFEKDLNISGVILNNLSGVRHESIVRKAIEMYTDCKVVGAIKKFKKQYMLQKHLGLIPPEQYSEVEQTIESLAEEIKESVDINKIKEIANKGEPLFLKTLPTLFYIESELVKKARGLKIGIIKDKAFQFYYPENIDILEKYGIEVIEINAILQRNLPKIDLLYIGGGFPERCADLLSKNMEFINSLRSAIINGLPVYAECGGLMYLGKTIEYENKIFPMLGILPLNFKMQPFPVAHGYTIVKVIEKNPFFKKNTILKGHEFHYSEIINYDKKDIRFCFKMQRGIGMINKYDGICYGKIFGTYTHLHCLSSPEWVKGIISVASGVMKSSSY